MESEKTFFPCFTNNSLNSIFKDTLQYMPLTQINTHVKSSSKKDSKIMNSSMLRFISSNSDNHIAISNTGYMVTNLDDQDQYAITNIGFNHGTPFWEIICPNKCFNIYVGIIKIGWKLPEKNNKHNNQVELFEFNTSTPRTIGIMLDFTKNEIKVYLEGALQTKFTRKLKDGKWFPCVKLREKGACVILNPYALEYDLINMNSAETIMQNVIEKIEETNESEITEIIKDIQLIITKLKNANNEEKNQLDLEKLNGLKLTYIKSTDNIIVTQNHSIKLITRENGIFDLNRAKIFNRPETSSDQITLYVNKESLKLLLIFMSNHAICQALSQNKEFLFSWKLISKALLTQNNLTHQNLFLEIPFNTMKTFINHMILYLLQISNSHDSISMIQILINFILHLDECLYAMTLHESAQPELKKYYDYYKPRLFSSFYRISSLMSLSMPKFSIIDLAEAGLYNEGDIVNKIKHFLDPAIDIEPILKEAQSNDIATILERALPNNPMVTGMPNPNVPLHVALNNLPYQNEKSEFYELISNEKSTYICNVSKEGEVTIWNTEFALIHMCHTSFRNSIDFKRFNVDEDVEEKEYKIEEGKEIDEDFTDEEDDVFNKENTQVNLFKSKKTKTIKEEGEIISLPNKQSITCQPLNPDPFFWDGMTDFSSPNPIEPQLVEKKKIIKGINKKKEKMQEEEKIDVSKGQTETETLDSNIKNTETTNNQFSILNSADGTSSLFSIGNSSYVKDEVKIHQQKELKNPQIEPKNQQEAIQTQEKEAKTEFSGLKLPIIEPVGFGGLFKSLSAKPAGTKYPMENTLPTKKPVFSKINQIITNSPPLFGMPNSSNPFNASPFIMDGINSPMGNLFDEPKLITDNPKPSQGDEKLDQKLFENRKFADKIAKSSLIVGNIMIPVMNYPLAPIIVGMIFNDIKQNVILLRLRRFAYHETYIKKFLIYAKDNQIYSNISGQWLQKSTDLENIQNHHTKEYKLTFSSLEPIFVGELRYKNIDKRTKGKLFSADMVVVDEKNINIQAEKFIDIIELNHAFDKVSKSETCNLLILTQKSGVSEIHNYKITIKDKVDDADINLEHIYSKKIDFPDQLKLNDCKLIQSNDKNNILLIQKDNDTAYEINISSHDELYNAKKITRHPSMNKSLYDNSLNEICSYSYISNQNKKQTIENFSSITSPQALKRTFKEIDEDPLIHLDFIYSSLNLKPIPHRLAFNHASSIQTHDNTKCLRSYIHLTNDQLNTNQLDLKFEDDPYCQVLILKLHLNLKLSQDNSDKIDIEKLEKFIDQKKSKYNNAKDILQNKNQKLNFDRQTNQHIRYIPLRITKYHGWPKNKIIVVSRLLTPTLDSFISNYPETQFILEHIHGNPLYIEQITISSPLKGTISEAMPISSGLIFTSNNLTSFRNIYQYKNMSFDDFLAFIKFKTNQNELLREDEPVGSFILDEGVETKTLDLAYKRIAKYILLLPTGFRNNDSKINKPVEITFFGVAGYVLSHNLNYTFSENFVNCTKNSLPINMNMALNIENVTYNESISINSATQISTNLFTGESIIRLPISQTIKNLHIQFNNENSLWNIEGITIELQDTNQFEEDRSLSSLVRQQLTNDADYDKFLGKIIKPFISSKIINNQVLSQEKRHILASITNQLLKVNKYILPRIEKDLLLDEFILSNILTSTTMVSTEIITLLNTFIGVKHNSLENCILNHLGLLKQFPNLTLNGLNTYLKFLQGCSINEENHLVKTIFDEILAIGRLIKKSRPLEYNILRTQYNLPQMSLEQYLFSDTHIFTVPDTKNIENVTQHKSPIICKLIYKDSGEVLQMLIDLGSTFHLNLIKLNFPENEKLYKLNIKVYYYIDNHDNGSSIKKLLISKIYNEEMFLQVSKFGQICNLKDFFEEHEDLKSIGFACSDIKTQYLDIQISYSLFPALQNNKNINNQYILPEIYGKLSKSSAEVCQDIKAIFDGLDNTQIKDKIKISDTLIYQQYSTDEAIKFYFKVISNQDSLAPTSIIENIEELQATMASLQNELYNKLKNYRTQDYLYKNHNEIRTLVCNIQNYQIKLYNIAESRTNIKTISIDALYYIAKKFQDLFIRLIDIPNLIKILDINEEILIKYIYEYFECFIIYESYQISKENILFISEIIKSLPAQAQIKIINKLFIDYLNHQQAISIIDTPLNKLYSQLSIIQIFESIDIPFIVLENLFQINDLTLNGQLCRAILYTRIYQNKSSDSKQIEDFKKYDHDNILNNIISTCKKIIRNSHTNDYTFVEKEYFLLCLLGLFEKILPFIKKDYKFFNGNNEIDFLICLIDCGIRLNNDEVMRIIQKIFQWLEDRELNQVKAKLNIMEYTENNSNNLKLIIKYELDLIKWIISYPVNNETPYSKLMDNDLSPLIWEKHLAFLLKTLLRLFERFSLSEKKEKFQGIDGEDNDDYEFENRKSKKKIIKEKHGNDLKNTEDLEEKKTNEMKSKIEIDKEPKNASKNQKEANNNEDIENEDEWIDQNSEVEEIEETPFPRIINENFEDEEIIGEKQGKENENVSKSTLNAEKINNENPYIIEILLILIDLLGTNTTKYNLFNNQLVWTQIISIIHYNKIFDSDKFYSLSLKLLQSYSITSTRIQQIVANNLSKVFERFMSKIITMDDLTPCYQGILTLINNIQNFNSTAKSISNEGEINPLNTLLVLSLDRFKNLTVKITKNIQSGSIKISKDGINAIKSLLVLSSQYLMNYINYGGKEGFKCNANHYRHHVDFIYNLFMSIVHPIVYIKYFFKHGDEKDIEQILTMLIQWFMKNKVTNKNINPWITKIYYICQMIQEIFDCLVEHEVDLTNVNKIALKCLLNTFLELYKSLKEALVTVRINSSIATERIKRYNTIFGELLTLWMNNDKLCSYFTLELKGFKILLEFIGVIDKNSINNTLNIVNEPSINLQDQIIRFLINQKRCLKSINFNIDSDKLIDVFSFSDNEIDLLPNEDHATKVTLISVHDENWPKNEIDLTVFKNKQSKLISFQFKGYTKNMAQLIIKLKNPIELSNIQLTFYVYNDNLNNQYSANEYCGVPSKIIIESGISLDNFEYLGEPIKEDRSDHHAYLLNYTLNVINTGNDNCLKRAQYIKIKLYKPQITFNESNNNFIENKEYKSVSTWIEHISINGVNIASIPSIQDFLDECGRNNISKLLKMIVDDNNQIFTNTLNKLIKLDFCLDINNTDMLNNIINLIKLKDDNIFNLFVCLCKKNNNLSTSIFKILLKSECIGKQAKLIGEIIYNNPYTISDHFAIFCRFILDKFNINNHVVIPNHPDDKIIISSHHDENIDKLISLIEILNYCLSLISMQEYNDNKIILLDVNKNDIENIVNTYCQYSQNENAILILKLILFFIFQTNKEINLNTPPQKLMQFMYDYCVKLYNNFPYKRTILLDIIGIFSVGSRQSTILLENNLDQFLDDIENSIKNTINNKLLKAYLNFVNCISLHKPYNEKLYNRKLLPKIYDLLKLNDSNSLMIFNSTDQEILKLMTTYAKNQVLGDPKQEQEFVDIIKKDLLLLEKKNDYSYVNNFLIPFIKAESTLPICFRPYDLTLKRPIPFILDEKAQDPYIFSSSILNPEETLGLTNVLKKHCSASGFYKTINKGEWELVHKTNIDADNSLVETLNKKLAKKGPYMIILEGIKINGMINDSTSNADGLKAKIGIVSALNWPNIANTSNFYLIQSKNLCTDSVIFFYENESKIHFVNSKNKGANFAQFNIYAGGGGVHFYYNNCAVMFLALVPGQTSYIMFDMFSITPLDGEKSSVGAQGHISGYQITNFEYWCLNEMKSGNNNITKQYSLVEKLKTKLLYPEWYNHQDPYTYYRIHPVYRIPATLTIQKLEKIFVSSINQSENLEPILENANDNYNKDISLKDIYESISNQDTKQEILDLNYDINAYQKSKSKLEINRKDIIEEDCIEYPLLNVFKKNGGIDIIIDITLKNISQWKNKEISIKWKKWIQDLHNFKDFPNYLNVFLKNKKCVEILFQVLTGIPDEQYVLSDDMKKYWEDQEQLSSKFIYQVLADSLKISNDPKACDLLIQNKIFDLIIDYLGLISKEPKRKWVDNPEEESNKEQENSNKMINKIAQSKNEEKKGPKKGVGYGTDYQQGGFGFGNANKNASNQVWNPNQYIEQIKARNEQILSLIDTLSNIFEIDGWKPPQIVLSTIYESSLLPLLEAAFRAGSLVDIGKDSELYLGYLRFVKSITKHKELIPCLIELDPHYYPKQRDSIKILLKQLKANAEIFLNCLYNTKLKNDNDKTHVDDTQIKAVSKKKSTKAFGFPLFPTSIGVNNTDGILSASNDATQANSIFVQNIKLLPMLGFSGGFGQMSNQYFINASAWQPANNIFVANQNTFKPVEKIEKKPVPTIFGKKVIEEQNEEVKEGSHITESVGKEFKKKYKKNLANHKIPKKSTDNISKIVVEAPIISDEKNPSKNIKNEKSVIKTLTTSEKIQELLAQEIISAYEMLESAINIFESDHSIKNNKIQEILSQPLPYAYRILLKDLRFNYMDMKVNGSYKHHYSNYANSGTPSSSKMLRLAQELADLSTSLPIEHTNSIFVRVDKAKLDLMKVLIMGSAGTPYAHGAFQYDIYIDNSYPNSPPKVNLETTGGGKVRFNPNLYNNGKVCLSLLGTWSGKGGENWNPKLSTILQVLLSIQSLIMTEDIYFNEPGLESQAGTPQGELENEGYSNVVRYCNIKFAMIEQIRNPSKGFENVIRRHFYLKKKEIMDEVSKWIVLAETKEASYQGCQNMNWGNIFKQNKMKYHDMLVDIAQELESELNKIPPPSGKDIVDNKLTQETITNKKASNKLVASLNKSSIMNAEEIDVSYDKDIKIKELNIHDAEVKDRWSRYIGAMGLEAVAKQANSSIFLSGLGTLGVEIAKNIVLSGVKRLTIHDIKPVIAVDLSGQFFIEASDIGTNRVFASLNKIQQLNYYVKVDSLIDKELPSNMDELDKLLSGYDVIILTEATNSIINFVDKYCRKSNKILIAADCYGPFARIFTDFGENFIVNDKNGEEIQEYLIADITNEPQAIVKLLNGTKHKFEDGDMILISEVQGLESLNYQKYTIKIINPTSFRIDVDTSKMGKYLRNGKVTEIKKPVTLNFKSFDDIMNSSCDIPYDSLLSTADFDKIGHSDILHIAFNAVDEFHKQRNKYPEPWNKVDAMDVLTYATILVDKYNAKIDDKKLKHMILAFSMTYKGVFSPLAAFIGGFVSQEAFKGITHKYMPIRQFFYTDVFEIIPNFNINDAESFYNGLPKYIQAQNNKEPQLIDRYYGLKICIGDEVFEKLANSKIFMIGVGAIGCELLKNFAMINVGIGEKGLITITDPDAIETSNLNRQFLFREKHIRKLKSQVAAAAIIQMNHALKGHIIAKSSKMHKETEDMFNDSFFEGLTIVVNALDNVQARKYIDSRCVKTKRPLLESGTLGPKGHVQVIIPYKTESYNSQEDPNDDNEIPYCTLKMFPEETLHCVEWARDKFGKIFTQKPKMLNKVIEELNNLSFDLQELKKLKDAIKLLKKRPTNFDDCIRYAREKFQKYFVNDIRQLLFTYPLDKTTKEGTLFWSSPKRPPTEIQFNPKNIMHAQFIMSCACLRATIFEIPYPKDCHDNITMLKLAEEASEIKIMDYKPSTEKAKALSSQLEKENKSEGVEQTIHEQDSQEPNNEYVLCLKEFKDLLNKIGKGKIIFPEEFEKDNDKNFHIDYIHSMTNNRASNYMLEPIDWITVKIKAGRIIPALATTTASIAALQTIEMIKLLKNCQTEQMKNSFLNFAVPILTFSEPGQVKVIKLTNKLSVTIWDNLEINLSRKANLKVFFDELENKFELIARDVINEGQAIYLHSIMHLPGKEEERTKILSTSIEKLLNIENDAESVTLIVTFTYKQDDKNILKDVPPVKIKFID